MGIAKLNGVLKLNVIQDSKEAPIPLLLPINLLEALGFDIKLKNNICVLEEQPWPDGQPRITSMTRLPSGHRCISIEEFDPAGWDALAEGKEFDAKFRAPGSERKCDSVLAQNATRNSNVLASEATRITSNKAARSVLALDATRNVLAPTYDQVAREMVRSRLTCGICGHPETVK